MKTAVVLLALLATAFCDQMVPIPSVVDGILVGNTTAPFQIDAFLDPQCIDCYNDWPTLRKVAADAAQYGVSFRFHLFPLPFHTHAFLLSQGAYYFIKNAPATDALKYVDLVYRIFPNFTNDQTANLTVNQITRNLIDIVAAEFPSYNRSQIVDAFTNTKYNMGARLSWKLATHLGVSGTPWFKANGVTIDGAAGFDYAGWITFLKQFVSIPNADKLIAENTVHRPDRNVVKTA